MEQNSKVMVLIDYRNIVEGLRSIGKEFPDQIFKELGRKYGIALTPRVFISHTVSRDTAMRLGRLGYFVIFCAPKKFGGPDTVDEKIHSECDLFASHQQISTFVLISNDKDFRETEELIKNYHKKVVTVTVDMETGALKCTDGETIPLPELRNASEIVTEKNDFIDVVMEMTKGEEISGIYRDQAWFIRLIIEECQRLYKNGDMVPPRAKSFDQLRTTLWNFIHYKARNKFSPRDCHQVLDALLNHTDILVQREQPRPPRKFYVYNPDHSFSL